MNVTRLGFIGFGEVTTYMLRGLHREGVGNHYILTRRATTYSRRKASLLGAGITESWDELFANTDVVFSAVRGHVALETAEKASEHIQQGQLFADLNNAVPSVKRAASAVITAKGAAYVDIGLIGLPVQHEHKALMYVSGVAAETFHHQMESFGMNTTIVSGEVGQASMIKALVNIYMKCLQGVCLELAISARFAGIQMSDLERLITDPLAEIPREKDVGFWITRGSLLAERKKAEMQDAVDMFMEMHIDPVMLSATVERLNRVSEFKLQDEFDVSVSYADYEKIIQRMFEIATEKGIEVK